MNTNAFEQEPIWWEITLHNSILLSVDVSRPVAAVNGLWKQHTPKLIQAKMHGESESEVSLSALACAVAGGSPQALVLDTAWGPGPVHTSSHMVRYQKLLCCTQH